MGFDKKCDNVILRCAHFLWKSVDTVQMVHVVRMVHMVEMFHMLHMVDTIYTVDTVEKMLGWFSPTRRVLGSFSGAMGALGGIS